LLLVSDLESSRDHSHAPGPSLWPVGFAVGVVVLLLGVVVSRWVLILGAVVSIVFGVLWLRDIRRERHEPAAVEAEPAPEPEPAYLPEDRYSRGTFLTLGTIGVGAAIGGLVTLPALGFTIGPAFLDQGMDDQDIGGLEDFPEGEFVIATFMTHPEQGEVSRQTVFVRYNGLLQSLPSFTVLSNRCVHLGCPVQPNADAEEENTKQIGDVTLIPAPVPSGFGCPCHGGQYDNEGNVTAGPPVRALDRFSFSIRDGHLYLGKPFSVAKVDGTGANAKIYKHAFAAPGVHVDGAESWLYPIQPPR
jgi:menaquinol-cytochrome c reductase iron-sulfur subunit